MSRPAVCFISSPAKCWVVPTPALPKLNFPGLARTAASTPARSRAGKSGAATRTRRDHRHHLEVVDGVVAQRLVHHSRNRVRIAHHVRGVAIPSDDIYGH